MNTKLTRFLLVMLWIVAAGTFIITLVLYEVDVLGASQSNYWAKEINTPNETKAIKTKLIQREAQKEVAKLSAIKTESAICSNQIKTIIHYQVPPELEDVMSSQDVYILLKPIMTNRTREKAVVIGLNRLNAIVEIKEIAQGTENKVEYCSNDILNTNGTKLIVVHNHPGKSGLPIPSIADVTTGKKVVKIFSNISEKFLVNFSIWTETSVGAPKIENITSLTEAELDNWQTVSNVFCNWGTTHNYFVCSSYSEVKVEDLITAFD